MTSPISATSTSMTLVTGSRRTPSADAAPFPVTRTPTPAVTEQQAASAPPPLPETAPPPVEAKPAPPPAPTTVTVKVSSVPEGAKIRNEEGDVLGVTPAELTLPRGDQPLTFTFERKRYETTERTLTPSGDALLEVALTKKKRKSRGKRKSRRRRKLNRTDVVNPYD